MPASPKTATATAAKTPAVLAAEKRAAARKAAPATSAPAAALPKATRSDAERLKEYATKEITSSMKDYFRWIKKTTGVTVDERSAYLGYMLRSHYQAANRAAK